MVVLVVLAGVVFLIFETLVLFTYGTDEHIE